MTVCADHHSLHSGQKENVDTPFGLAARRAGWHETPAKFELRTVYVRGPLAMVADRLSW